MLSRSQVLAVALGLTALVFSVDFAAPIGIAVCMLYAGPTFIAALSPNRWDMWTVAGISIVLTWIDLLVALQTDYIWVAPFNRGLSTIAIIGAGGLGAVLKRASGRMATADWLRESERRSAEVLNGALDAIVTIDERGYVLHWNLQAANTFGWTALEAIERPLVDLIIPERFHEAHRQGLARFLATGEGPLINQRIEISARRRDGEEIPIELGLIAVKVQGAYQFTAFIQDLSERKRLERLFQQAVESAPLAMLMVNEQGTIELANSEVSRLFGYEQHELVGRSVDLLVPERFRSQHPAHRQEFCAAPVARRMGAGRELFGLRKDNSEFPVEIGLNPVHSEHGTRVIVAVADITERKSLERMFRQAVESAPVAMLMVDDQRRIVLANPQTLRLFGYEAAELIGQPVDRLVIERQREDVVEVHRACLVAPATPLTYTGPQFHCIRKDGSEFPVEFGSTPVVTGHGNSVLAVITDISERLATEEQRARHAAELERSNQELQQFAFVASHDLQEPLRKVASCCQILKDDYGQVLDDTGREWLEFAIGGAKRMRQFVRDLLEYSRVGRFDKPVASVDAEAAVRQALDILELAIEESLAVVDCGPLPQVSANERELVQLFQNLIANAIKYRGESPPQITIGAERHGAFWEFFVRDNGIGIDPEHFERIFAIFQRLQTKEQDAGTGIGLAICRKIVQRVGGRIWVASDPGRGSTFYFTLPEAETRGARHGLIRETLTAGAP